jgi:dihydrofolate reductase
MAGEGMAKTGGILLGRRTYEDFYAVWAHQPDNPFTTALNNTQKYVVSTTLKEPLAWVNSTLLKGDVVAAVARLKEEMDKDLVVLGSGELVRSMMGLGIIDEYILLIHPLILGTGQRLFPDGSPFAALRLADTRPTTTGVLIATYQVIGPADEKTGQVQREERDHA